MIVNITDSLPVHSSKVYGSRSLDQVRYLVVHHSATTSGSPQAFANHHVNTNGWPGIGYHFVIQPDGQVYQTNDLNTISYHVKNNNTKSIGICMTGNFDVGDSAPTQAQYSSLVSLLADLKSDLGTHLNIVGHRDLQVKACPGKNVSIEKIRFDVDALLNVSEPYYVPDNSDTHVHTGVEAAVNTVIGGNEDETFGSKKMAFIVLGLVFLTISFLGIKLLF